MYSLYFYVDNIKTWSCWLPLDFESAISIVYDIKLTGTSLGRFDSDCYNKRMSINKGEVEKNRKRNL